MNRCNLYLNFSVIGEVSWSVMDHQVHIRAVCPFEEGYIYRATLRTGELALPLGVMVPQDGVFQAGKVFPLDKCGQLLRAIEPRGEIYRCMPGEEESWPLPFPFSRLILAAGCKLSLDDALLNNAVAQERGTLYAHFGDKTYIAFPLKEDEPSPFLPFFCISTIIDGSQGRYGALCMDEDGFLCTL